MFKRIHSYGCRIHTSRRFVVGKNIAAPQTEKDNVSKGMFNISECHLCDQKLVGLDG